LRYMTAALANYDSQLPVEIEFRRHTWPQDRYVMADQAGWKPDEHHGMVRDLASHLCDVWTIVDTYTHNFVGIGDYRQETKLGGAELRASCVFSDLAYGTRSEHSAKIRMTLAQCCTHLTNVVLDGNSVARTTVLFEADQLHLVEDLVSIDDADFVLRKTQR